MTHSRYDITDLSDRAQEDYDGLEDTRKQSTLIPLTSFVFAFPNMHCLVTELIEEEIRQGIPSNRILLGGFSQGNCNR